MKYRSTILAAMILSLCVAAAYKSRPDANKPADNTPAATLKVGDDAPAISVDKWVKNPVELQKGKVYVVEFWATWCGPCRASIPHLTDLQKKYLDKGVVIIGMNLGEDAGTAGKFVNQMGDKMNYAVATDAKGQTASNYMRAAGQTGIPCAFLVGRDGKIAWIGHPAQIEKPLETAAAAK